MAMGYGGLFEWRIPPIHGQRMARYQLDPAYANPIPQGTPVKAMTGTASLAGVTLVTPAATADVLLPGWSGVAVREYGPRFGYTRDNLDEFLIGSEAMQLIRPGDMVQVISGEGVKFAIRNGAGTFGIVEAPGAAGGPDAAQTMINLTTPPVIGDGIKPSGTPNLTAGPWAVAATGAAWAMVTEVGTAHVEAVLGRTVAALT